MVAKNPSRCLCSRCDRWSMPPAKHPLTISVEAGDSVDFPRRWKSLSLRAAPPRFIHGWSVSGLSGGFRAVTMMTRDFVRLPSSPQTREGV